MCMYECVQACIIACTHIYESICMYAYICVCMNADIHICYMHVDILECRQTCMNGHKSVARN